MQRNSRRLFLLPFVFLALAACSGQHGGGAVVPTTTNGQAQETVHSQSVTSAASSAAGSFSQTLRAKGLTDVSKAAPLQNVHILITLAHQNQTALQKLIADQSTPHSASYKKFLTPKQFDTKFGASTQTRTRIKTALTSAGFAVDTDRFGASVIEADVPAATAESYFQTQLHNVQETSGRIALLPNAVPTIPTDLQTDVVSVVGLDTTEVTKPRTEIACPEVIGGGSCPCSGCGGGGVVGTPPPAPPPPTPPPTPGSAYPSFGPGQPLVPPPGYVDDTTFNNYGYAPYTYAHDYDMPVQYGFAGDPSFPVGILIDADVSDSDLGQFYAAMGVNRTGNLVRLGGSYGTSGSYEATLDVETVSALAPASTIYLYRIPTLSGGDIVAGMNSVVQDNAVAVLSISIAGCENEGWPSLYEVASAEDSAAAQASAEGITVVAASGDSGGLAYLSGCSSVMAPAASSYVVAVGGSSPYSGPPGYPPTNAYEMNPNGQGWAFAWGQTISFTSPACSVSDFCGTGGGASTHFQTPEMPTACGGPWRCVPDIALPADIFWAGYLVFNGSPVPGGGANGTSFGTPMFAAMQAEIDQRQGSRKGNVVGQLYNLLATYGYGPFTGGQPNVFHDITQGNSFRYRIAGRLGLEFYGIVA
jgi:subtilase family serine protease